MKYCLLLVAAISLSANAAEVTEQSKPLSPDILGGDEGSACEMILCLSNPSGKELKECKKSLKKYFDMKPKRRPGYLKKCPMVK